MALQTSCLTCLTLCGGHAPRVPMPKSPTAVLREAAEAGLEDRVARLLAEGIDINKADETGATPLYAASFKGHANVVGLLLEAGAMLENKGAPGVMPLYIASEQGHDDVVALLIAGGAPLDKGIRGTPLAVACDRGHSRVVARLLSAGAEVDRPSWAGGTALYVASARGHDAVVSQLLEAGALVDKALTSGKAGKTSLHIACSNGHSGVASRLLKSGANVRTADARGRTPRDVARSDEIRALLDAAVAEAKERCRAAAVAVMVMHRGPGVDRRLLQVLGRLRLKLCVQVLALLFVARKRAMRHGWACRGRAWHGGA